VRLGLGLLAGLSLFALYLYFLNIFVVPIVGGPMDAVESAIFYTMIFRVLVLLLVPSLRKLGAQFKIVILSFEAFILFLLVVVAVLSGSTAYGQVIAKILTAWLMSALIVVTPYSIYELSLMMYKDTSMTALAVSAAPLGAICLFLANLAVRIPNPPSGIGNFGAVLITSLKDQPSFAGSTVAGESPFISGVSVLFFLSIIVYIVFHQAQTSLDFTSATKYHYPLSLMVMGSLVTFLWLFFAAGFLNGNVFEVLSVPAASISIILWVVCRER
jgi:hypothetical protein